MATIATGPTRSIQKLLQRYAVLPLQVQDNRCVCVGDLVVVVVVVVTVVVVLAMVFVVVVVVAAAIVVDVLCESRSGADRPCDGLHASCVGCAVALRCGGRCFRFLSRASLSRVCATYIAFDSSFSLCDDVVAGVVM